MVTKTAIAMAVLTPLIFLSVIETIISFFFSLFLQTPIQFPLVDWIFLILSYVALLFLKIVRLFLLIIVSIIPPFTYLRLAFETLYDITLQLLTLPLLVLYPLLSIFIVGSPLDPIITAQASITLIVDTFFIGGPLVLINPPPGNVMHIFFNLGNIDEILTKLAAGMTYLGLRRTTMLSTILFYAGLSKKERTTAWSFYGREPKTEYDYDVDFGGSGTYTEDVTTAGEDGKTGPY